MEELRDVQVFLAPPNKTLRGKQAALQHFVDNGVLQRHRVKYWKHRLTEQATMVFTSDDQALWYLVRSRRVKPLSEQWARILAD